MKFEYQAVDADGAIVRGIIEASNAQKVLQILLHKQLHPLDIKHLTESTVELNRLNSLKRKLEGTKMELKSKKNIEAKTEHVNSLEQPKQPKQSIDWTYILFVLMIVIIISASLLKLGI